MGRKIVLFFIFLVFLIFPKPVFAVCTLPPPPSSLTPTGQITPGVHPITWSAVTEAVNYKLRIHDQTTGAWNGAAVCGLGVNGSEVCLDTTALSYPYNFQNGHTYSIWVHANNSCGYSDPIMRSISVAYTLPTTASPISPHNPVSFYVSPTGSDSNPGTESQPFKTLEKARQVVRAINSNMTADIAVYLRGGYYELAAPLIFDSSDSGTNGHNIFYLNYSNEVPLISGGKRITGWQKEGNKWKAHVGTNLQTRQLYVNGVRAVRARSDGGLPGAAKTATGFITTDLTMQNWKNKTDIELVSKNEWKMFRCGVQSISGGGITVKQPCWTNANNHDPFTMGNGSVWVENALELLDSPGEWYLDRVTGWLYYMPQVGEDMSTAVAIAPVLETLIIGTGILDNPIHNLVFQGLTFAYATWLRPNTNDGYAQIQADYTMAGRIYSNPSDGVYPSGSWTKTPANVQFRLAKDIRFQKNNFLHLGAVGLGFEYGSKDNIIIGNHFTDISGSAITIGDADKPNTTDEREITRGNQITNNYIHKVAAEYWGSVGMWLGYVANSLIAHNEVTDLPYTGISIGWGWGANDQTVARDNWIVGNYVHDYLKILRDGGGIYSLSAQPGNVYMENLLTDQHNEYGAMYLDNLSRYITVIGNVIFNNTRSAIFKGGDHTIADNWWQERYGGDIWWYNDAASCLPTPCGANNVSNNHAITSLDQVPSSIRDNAGLESSFQSIKNLPVLPLPTVQNEIVTILNLRQLLAAFTNIFDYNRLVSNFGK